MVEIKEHDLSEDIFSLNLNPTCADRIRERKLSENEDTPSNNEYLEELGSNPSKQFRAHVFVDFTDNEISLTKGQIITDLVKVILGI